MMTLKKIIEETDTRAGRIFDLTVQWLIVASLLIFSVQTLPTLTFPVRSALAVAEWVAVILFTIEYIARVWVAENKRAYIFSFFGLIDLLAILPSYLALGIDSVFIRAVRFLRIFLVLKLVRYQSAINRLREAYNIVHEELVLFGIGTVIMLYLAAVGIYFFEHTAQPEVFQSVFHCLWWAIVTVTTLGYGDVVPITLGGRLFTAGVLIIGIGVVAVPTGLFASALSQVRTREQASDE